MNYKLIGMRIRKCRQQNGLTQEQLAEMAGISLSFCGHIERGSRKMSLETLCSIAAALGCSTDKLLGTGFECKKQTAALELLALAEQLAGMLDAEDDSRYSENQDDKSIPARRELAGH